MFIAALVLITRNWKQHRCPSIGEWIKKMWYIYTVEYYTILKKSKGIHKVTAKTKSHLKAHMETYSRIF